MSQNYSLLFYLKKPKNYQNGPKPVYMRITVKGIPKEISTGRFCAPERWSSKANRSIGTREDAKLLNSYLDTLAFWIEQIHSSLIKSEVEVTSSTIRNNFLGVTERPLFLLEIFSSHNDEMLALLGNGFKPNTLKGYKTSYSHLKDYFASKLDLADLDVKKIDHTFITGYEFFLRSELKCSPVSAAKYMKHLRKIINKCVAHQWITVNPFALYKNTAVCFPYFRTNQK